MSGELDKEFADPRLHVRKNGSNSAMDVYERISHHLGILQLVEAKYTY